MASSRDEISSILPQIQYQPKDPESYRPPIGLIGCGGITDYHLQAYRDAGYEIVALCDVDLDSAKQRRDEYYPSAEVFDDHRALLKIESLEVVDIATHPEVRAALIEDALHADKHVLSQKPYVLDLETGRRLADLADEQGVLLAVNQNARWAPHFSYTREAVRAGLIGDVLGLHCGVHWDHSWVEGTEFAKIEDLILYDFAIHWFDFVTTVMGDQQPQSVYASVAKSPSQKIEPPLLAQVVVEYPNAQVSLAFDAHVPQGGWETTVVTGSRGIIRCSGTDNKTQTVYVENEEGSFSPKLSGSWFPGGFHGTMAELLLAIAENRQPSHSARNNLRSLELCFAAVASSHSGEPILPGTVDKLGAVPLDS